MRQAVALPEGGDVLGRDRHFVKGVAGQRRDRHLLGPGFGQAQHVGARVLGDGHQPFGPACGVADEAAHVEGVAAFVHAQRRVEIAEVEHGHHGRAGDAGRHVGGRKKDDIGLVPPKRPGQGQPVEGEAVSRRQHPLRRFGKRAHMAFVGVVEQAFVPAGIEDRAHEPQQVLLGAAGGIVQGAGVDGDAHGRPQPIRPCFLRANARMGSMRALTCVGRRRPPRSAPHWAISDCTRISTPTSLMRNSCHAPVPWRCWQA